MFLLYPKFQKWNFSSGRVAMRCKADVPKCCNVATFGNFLASIVPKFANVEEFGSSFDVQL